MTGKIVVGFDGSKGSHRALEEAIRLAVLGKSRLIVVSIEDLPHYPGTMGEVIEEQDMANVHVKKLHHEAKKVALKSGLQIETITRIGHPAKGLVDFTNEIKPDLLVIGHTGHSELWGTFLGTTADKVVRHATCSVLVVR